MEIIILVVAIVWVLRVAFKGLFSVGAGKGYKPGKDSKPLGITHYFASIIEGRNPAKDETESVLGWSFGKIWKWGKKIFWLPNKIWCHWIERKWIINTCTVIFWLIVLAIALS